MPTHSKPSALDTVNLRSPSALLRRTARSSRKPFALPSSATVPSYAATTSATSYSSSFVAVLVRLVSTLAAHKPRTCVARRADSPPSLGSTMSRRALPSASAPSGVSHGFLADIRLLDSAARPSSQAPSASAAPPSATSSPPGTEARRRRRHRRRHPHRHPPSARPQADSDHVAAPAASQSAARTAGE